jgi:hypothetical protein
MVDLMDELKTLLEKDRIVETLNTLFIRTDDKDWPAVESLFTDEVVFDIRPDKSEGAPARMKPREITSSWDTGLAEIEELHHQAGNYIVTVEGDSARAFCYGIAMHYREIESGRNTRTFVGSYEFELVKAAERWRISLFKYNLKYVDGNRDLA